MEKNPVITKPAEELIPALNSMFKRLGYRRYKMSKFEEYELYLENKNFLTCENIITFNDRSGRLLALKPDVTLSIVKNTGSSALPQKLYYNENVYRTKDTGFCEIMQVGLEYIGEVDLYSLAEVISLASKSLNEISSDYVIDISHMGLITGLFESLDITIGVREKLISCLESKNAHEIIALCREYCISDDFCDKLCTLSSLYGEFGETIEKARKICVNDTMNSALDSLFALYEVMSMFGVCDRLKLDLSLINDIGYYNGIIFQGFVNGIPSSILSGGRYDKLVEKFGRKCGAVGFAIYTDLLELYGCEKTDTDVDVLLVYREDTPAKNVAEEVKKLTDEGYSVNCRKAGNALPKSGFEKIINI